MAFIKNKSGEERIGEWVKTKKLHNSLGGTFEIGSEVRIVGYSNRGYDIEDEYGNRMTEIGYEI